MKKEKQGKNRTLDFHWLPKYETTSIIAISRPILRICCVIDVLCKILLVFSYYCFFFPFHVALFAILYPCLPSFTLSEIKHISRDKLYSKYTFLLNHIKRPASVDKAGILQQSQSLGFNIEKKIRYRKPMKNLLGKTIQNKKCVLKYYQRTQVAGINKCYLNC